MYYKTGDSLDGFNFVFTDIGSVDATSVSENQYTWSSLDKLILNMVPGDALAVLDLCDIGSNVKDVLSRMSKIMMGVVPLWIRDLPTSYVNRFDMLANRSALELVAYGLQVGAGVDMFRISAGRPEIQYPDGWECMYVEWKARKLSSKEFLEKSGLKKATFYNRLADYAPIYEQNLVYRNLWHIA